MELPNICLVQLRTTGPLTEVILTARVSASHQHHTHAQIQPSQVSRASVSCLPGGRPQGVWWPLPHLRRACAWQSFLDGFVIPGERYELWARGSVADTKPWGSAAAGNATCYVLACSSSLVRGHTMA